MTCRIASVTLYHFYDTHTGALIPLHLLTSAYMHLTYPIHLYPTYGLSDLLPQGVCTLRRRLWLYKAGCMLQVDSLCLGSLDQRTSVAYSNRVPLAPVAPSLPRELN